MQFNSWYQLDRFDSRDLLPKGAIDSGHETHVPSTMWQHSWRGIPHSFQPSPTVREAVWDFLQNSGEAGSWLL